MDQHADSPPSYLHRASAWLVGSFAVLALTASVVLAFMESSSSVSQRTREIIRIALGAQRRMVYQLILKQAGRLIAAGLVAGLVGSIAAGSLSCANCSSARKHRDAFALTTVVVVLGISALMATISRPAALLPVNPLSTTL